MQPWFIHALVGVVATGGMMALFKVPTSKGHNKYFYSFLGFLVATLTSLFAFFDSIHLDYYAMMFSFAWGSGYAILVMLQMELLRKLDTNALFPITSISSHVLVVIIGVSFFHDKISMLQFFGIILTFLVIGLYNKVHKHITLQNGLLPMVVGIILISTSTKFIQKFGSITTEIQNFIFWQLFFSMLASIVILLITHFKTPGQRIEVSRKVVLWAVALGVLNFIGTAEITKALSIGPFSLVFTINSFYTIITSLVAWKLFGEELTKRKAAFVLVAIFTVILIGLG